MPQHFRFLDGEQPQLFLPLQLDRNKTVLGQFSFDGIARLRPGVTLAAANTDIARMIPTVWTSFPAPPGFSIDLFHKAQLGPKVRPLSQDVVGDVGKLLWVLMGSHRCGAADCLRECGEPAAGARGRTASANWRCVRHWVRAGGGL